MSVLAVLLLAAGALPVPAIDPASGVSLQITGSFREPPAAGFLPLRAELRNDTGRPGTWTLRFTSQASDSVTTSRFTLGAEAGATRREELVVPLADGCTAHGMCLTNVSLELEGPGVTGGLTTLVWRRISNPLPPFAMSESVARGLWEELEAEAGSGSSPAGCRFDPSDLPSDWRAFSFFERVFLTSAEWASLAPGPRQALRAWVARGGRLLLSDAAATEGPLGLGSMGGLGGHAEEVRQWAVAPDVALFGGQVEDPGGFLRRVPAVTVESGPVGLFMVLFALVVGPFNLFVLCRGPRRPRVFWTVPAFSLLASLALGAFILLQDGTGGRGERFTTVVLLPEDHLAVVLQEQAVRTGVLLSRAFESSEPLLIAALGPRDRLRGRLRLDGSRVDGLFASRARQGHYLETLRPSRARLSLLAAGGGLQVVSSLPGPLLELDVRDEGGRHWQARDVTPGRPAPLRPATGNPTWLALAKAGPRSSALLQRRLDALEPGTFLGLGRGAAAIETLPGLDWSDTVVYVGAVSREAP